MIFIEETMINTVSVFESEVKVALNNDEMRLYRYISLLHFFKHKYLKENNKNYNDEIHEKATIKLDD